MTTEQAKPYICVGVDGSRESRHALRWAARLAPALGAEIEALAVWHSPVLVFGPPPVEFTPAPELHTEKALTAAVDAVFGADRPSELRLRVRKGHPAEVLADRGHTAALIIVGRRGIGGIKGLLQGSVSRFVSEHAACPVLVVHADDGISPND